MVSVVAQNSEEDHEPIVYQTAVGFYVDLGKETNLYGIQIKQFLSWEHALNGQVLVGDKTLVLGLDYSFNGMVPMHLLYRNLSWYAGAGGEVTFAKGEDNNAFAIRPLLGLEYKMKKQPLVFHVELKPKWTFGSTGDFELSNFGLGLRYVLKRDIW